MSKYAYADMQMLNYPKPNNKQLILNHFYQWFKEVDVSIKKHAI
jgi:hypothetical protein